MIKFEFPKTITKRDMDLLPWSEGILERHTNGSMLMLQTPKIGSMLIRNNFFPKSCDDDPFVLIGNPIDSWWQSTDLKWCDWFCSSPQEEVRQRLFEVGYYEFNEETGVYDFRGRDVAYLYLKFNIDFND